MKIEKSIPAPEPKRWGNRLTESLKAMLPGDSVLLDRKIAAALRAYGRYHQWEMTQREETGGKVRVWKIK